MEQLEISAMTYGPFGVAHLNGKTVLTPNVAPGDRVEVEITSTRRDYAVARPVRLLRAGAERREPPCRYLPRCGGCDWQQIEYHAQVRIKAELIAAEFRRALGVELDPKGLVAAADAEFAYRSRVRLKIDRDGAIGYHEFGSNRFVAIADCAVAGVPIDAAAALARELRRGCDEIEIVAAADRQVLVAYLGRTPVTRDLAIGRRLIETDQRVAGIVMRAGAAREVLGDATITLEPEAGCAIRAEADQFSQVNPAQNMKLVATVMAMAGIETDTPVLDLFCGAGNFSLPAVRRGAIVTGVDADGLAVAAARANAARMGLHQAQFVAMAAAETSQFLRRAKYRPAIVILDPPRAGAFALMEGITQLAAQRVIYVSCDIATLVRDLNALIKHRYRIGRVAGFDFFPNTHHVEVAAEMVLT
jgi:23S rRNA (uracil1939-C5)-methyltransferase